MDDVQIEEQFAETNGRIERLDGRMDRLEGRMDRFEGRMDRLNARLDPLDGRADHIEQILPTLATKADLKALREELRSDIDMLAKHLADLITRNRG